MKERTRSEGRNKWKEMKVNMENLLEEFGCAGVGGEGLDSEAFSVLFVLVFIGFKYGKDMKLFEADVVEARKDSW